MIDKNRHACMQIKNFYWDVFTEKDVMTIHMHHPYTFTLRYFCLQTIVGSVFKLVELQAAISNASCPAMGFTV